jgi:hypothetical protein
VDQYGGEMRFTLRTPVLASENSGVKKPNSSTWSKKEAIWNENALFFKFFCTKKGFVIKALTYIPKLAINAWGIN